MGLKSGIAIAILVFVVFIVLGLSLSDFFESVGAP